MSQTVKDVKGVKCKTPAELLKENIARRNNNTEDNLRSYIHQIRLQYSTPTPRNGNCFFEAVSDQLKRLGLPPQNASHLRSNVIAFCKENPILQREDGDVDIKNFVEGDLGGYLDRMSNDGEWADHVMVVYMAEFLKRDILIVTSSPNADPDKNILCINNRTAGEEPLLLGHVWEYHYQSLIPMPETPKLQEEEKNFLRFFLLISLVSPKIIRNYFDTKFPTSSLAQVINQHQQTILDLVGRRVLTVAQEDILRAIPGTKWPPCNRAIAITATSSEDFDLTLMICLLRNIGSIPKPINGWDKLPPTNEKTDGAQLARLKFYRNKLAHATDHKIQTSDFQNQWKEVEEALVDLNGGQHVPEINDVLNYDLDEPNTNLKQELETLKRENMIIEKKMTSAIASEQQTKSEFEHYKTGKLPKNIEEMNKMMIKTWEKEDKPYFETARGIRFMKALHETSLMVVIGNSGNGKTALVRHAALKLKNEDNFEIVPIEFPEQILKYRTNKKQVFVIDDVVGKYSVDLDLLKNWERMNEKLKACINGDNGIKIICTLRKQVAKSNYFASFDSVLAAHQFELDDHLTYDEKRQILLNHYRNSKMPTPLSSEEIDKICENNYAFPLLCRLVNLKARFDNRIRFFEAPYEILNGEFDNLCNRCPNDYFILVVCMLLGGTIEVLEFFSKANGELLRQVSNSCRDDTNIGEIGVRDSLRKMEGTYLTKITTFKYGFIHDKVFESVLSNFALKSPRVMFHVCTFTLIRDHILTAGSRLQFSDGTPLEEDQAIWEVLGNRVLCELEEGRFLNVLLSQIIENVDFVNHLDSLISKKSFNYSYKLLDTEYPFYRDERRISDVLLDDIFDQKRNNADLHTINKNAVKFVMSNKPCCKLIYWIVAFGRDNLFHCFWKNLKKSHIETCIRKTLIENLFLFYPVPLLSVAILGGNLKIIKTLIDVGGNGSYYNHLTDGYSQLLQAVQVGSYDIVSILLRRGFSVNEGDLFRETTPLQECALTGNMEILNLLLDNNAQMNTILASGLTSFYNLYDLYLNDTISHNIMSAIVRKDSGNTDLHVAVLNKDRSTVESLMRAGTEHLMTQNNNGQTALHLAALFGEFEIMKLLLEENDSRNKRNILSFSRSFINIGDLNGVRPLHLAVMRNDYDYVDLLLRHKASTFCEDNLRRTPCHFVQCARIATITAFTFFYEGKCRRN